MHDAYIGRRSENNIKCVVHDDVRLSQFHSLWNVEYIWFFHGALQLWGLIGQTDVRQKHRIMPPP